MSYQKVIEYTEELNSLLKKAKDGEIPMDKEYDNKVDDLLNHINEELDSGYIMKCLDCGFKMIGSEYFEVCAKCGSENIKNEKVDNYHEKMIKEFTNKWKYRYECPIDGKILTGVEINSCPKCGLPVAKIEYKYLRRK